MTSSSIKETQIQNLILCIYYNMFSSTGCDIQTLYSQLYIYIEIIMSF